MVSTTPSSERIEKIGTTVLHWWDLAYYKLCGDLKEPLQGNLDRDLRPSLHMVRDVWQEVREEAQQILEDQLKVSSARQPFTTHLSRLSRFGDAQARTLPGRKIDYHVLHHLCEEDAIASLAVCKTALFITFPVRNSAACIQTILRSVYQDLARGPKILHPIFTVIVHDTTEDSLPEVMRFFANHPDLDYAIIQLPPEIHGALPLSLNLAYCEQMQLVSKWKQLLPGLRCFYMYVDDDAVIHSCSQDSGIVANVRQFEIDPHLRLISGQPVDDRVGVSAFHSFANIHTRRDVALCMPPRPYGYGGAGGVMVRFEEFPARGLPLAGLGGISLQAYIHTLVDPEEIESLPHSRWIARSNPRVVWRHPTKDDLFSWTAYSKVIQVGWKRAFEWYPSASTFIWRKKIRQSRQATSEFFSECVPESVSLKLYIGNMAIRQYFMSIIRTQQEIGYAQLACLTLKRHTNVAESSGERGLIVL